MSRTVLRVSAFAAIASIAVLVPLGPALAKRPAGGNPGPAPTALQASAMLPVWYGGTCYRAIRMYDREYYVPSACWQSPFAEADLTDVSRSTPTAIANATIVFSTVGGEAICTATTRSDGSATCPLTVDQKQQIIEDGKYVASFDGDAAYQPSRATGAATSVSASPFSMPYCQGNCYLIHP